MELGPPGPGSPRSGPSRLGTRSKVARRSLRAAAKVSGRRWDGRARGHPTLLGTETHQPTQGSGHQLLSRAGAARAVPQPSGRAEALPWLPPPAARAAAGSHSSAGRHRFPRPVCRGQRDDCWTLPSCPARSCRGRFPPPPQPRAHPAPAQPLRAQLVTQRPPGRAALAQLGNRAEPWTLGPRAGPGCSVKCSRL